MILGHDSHSAVRKRMKTTGLIQRRGGDREIQGVWHSSNSTVTTNPLVIIREKLRKQRE